MKQQKQYGLAPVAIVLIIIGTLVVGCGGYWIYNNIFKAGPVTEQPPINEEWPSDETAGWQTYRNEEYEFEFKYPIEYKTIEHKDGWSNALVLLVKSNGYAQSFDFAVELWSSKFAFKQKHGHDYDIIKKIDNKYITLWNINKEKDIEKVISTFQFIPKNELMRWKTYQNSEYGFEFKYPQHWKMSAIKHGKEPIIDFIIADNSSSKDCFDKENKSDFINCPEYIEVQLNYSQTKSIAELLNNQLKNDSYINVGKIPNIDGVEYALKAAPYYKYAKFLNENYYIYILYYCDLNICKNTDNFKTVLSTFKFIE